MRQLHTPAAAAAYSSSPDRARKQQPTPAAHKGGPKAIVAAKEHWPSQYEEIGRITGQYSIPRKQVFAVVELGATQFKVSPGDLLVTEKLRNVDVNDRISIRRVLMLGSCHETIIGRPLVPGASVTAAIEEQFQDAKVLIFKKRRRKNSRRLNGHRQDLTSVRIIDIEGITETPQETSGNVAAQQEARAA
ncbi:hypothetical protein CVIRNUC_001795 [Coccomyxa viridis]|uniref:Large ribosomal subunit protein bL21m n=1 Tax=Coccomyxa viridis TaxID=1274662 RepID=A0AAV1HXL1_9CHLO|nr:hypothetical protein CVIRNUC_001795 [Coccomyxa viridis]